MSTASRKESCIDGVRNGSGIGGSNDTYRSIGIGLRYPVIAPSQLVAHSHLLLLVEGAHVQLGASAFPRSALLGVLDVVEAGAGGLGDAELGGTVLDALAHGGDVVGSGLEGYAVAVG